VLLETVEPLTATMLAYIVLGERLQPVQWLGAALVVLAVVVVSGGLRRAHRSG
jgi:drug/metabolite transporter (DMT)-like permease